MSATLLLGAIDSNKNKKVNFPLYRSCKRKVRRKYVVYSHVYNYIILYYVDKNFIRNVIASIELFIEPLCL